MEADPARAAELYEQSCSRGSPEGCNNLAFMTAEGQGVEANPTRAVELYGMACDEGLQSACEARQALSESADVLPESTDEPR